MAKKDLRAQMDAARAAAAFIGAAQEAQEVREEDEARSEGASEKVPEKAVPNDGADPAPSLAAEELGDSYTAPGKATAKGASGSAKKDAAARAPESGKTASSRRTPRQVKRASADVTLASEIPDYFSEPADYSEELLGMPSALQTADDVAPQAPAEATKAKRARKPRMKAVEAEPADEPATSRMTAQVLVPMTSEQREHADLLAQVMKITRAEVMRQALDEYWESHKSELQAAVVAYEELIRKLMK